MDKPVQSHRPRKFPVAGHRVTAFPSERQQLREQREREKRRKYRERWEVRPGQQPAMLERTSQLLRQNPIAVRARKAAEEEFELAQVRAACWQACYSACATQKRHSHTHSQHCVINQSLGYPPISQHLASTWGTFRRRNKRFNEERASLRKLVSAVNETALD